MLSHRILTGLFISLPIVTMVVYAQSHSMLSSVTGFTNQNSSTINSSLISDRLNTTTSRTPITANGFQTAVFAGGCFWGVEAVFEDLKGVSNVVSGYSGGTQATANYQKVSDGKTGHAEVVRVTYDPNQISYEQLLKVFFIVAHDPTELNSQGPDSGTQYRSAIFFTNGDQQQAAKAYISQLDKEQVFKKPIVTQLAPLEEFHPAEEYHQNFLVRNRTYPYVVVNDLPKLDRLRQEFPKLVK